MKLGGVIWRAYQGPKGRSLRSEGRSGGEVLGEGSEPPPTSWRVRGVL